MHNPIYTRCRWLLGARMLALAIVMVAAAACEASPPPEKPPPDQVLAGAGDIGACGAAGQRYAGLSRDVSGRPAADGASCGLDRGEANDRTRI